MISGARPRSFFHCNARTAIFKFAQPVKPHCIEAFKNIALFAVLRRAAMLIAEFENILKARNDPFLLRRIGA